MYVFRCEKTIGKLLTFYQTKTTFTPTLGAVQSKDLKRGDVVIGLNSSCSSSWSSSPVASVTDDPSVMAWRNTPSMVWSTAYSWSATSDHSVNRQLSIKFKKPTIGIKS